MQVPLLHTGVMPLQWFPQEPQLFGSFAVLASQPSANTLLQSANPATQAAMPHVEPEQLALATLAVPVQEWPHAPQLETLFVTLVSQPLAATPSQSAKPKMQAAIVHLAIVQEDEPVFGRPAQLAPHMPQLFTSDARLVGQPAMGIPEQLANPARQLWMHVPIWQRAALLGPVEQTPPHWPQLFGSETRLTQAPPQLVSPGMHADMEASAALPSGSFGKSTPTDALPLRCISRVTLTGGMTATLAVTFWTLIQLGVVIGLTIAQGPENAAAEKESLPRGKPFSAKTLDEPAMPSNERTVVR
jgi:hypothetical protein